MVKKHTKTTSKGNESAVEKFYHKVGSGGAKDTVNPFLTHMYCRMSFLSWYRVMLSKKRDENIQELGQQYERADLKPKEKDKEKKINIDNYREAVVVDIETIADMTVSSDEEAALENKPDSKKQLLAGENGEKVT